MNRNIKEAAEEYINPFYGEMKTRYGALKVPDINEDTEKQMKLKPILKFDDWGNELGN